MVNPAMFVPYNERNVPVINAEPWLQVDKNSEDHIRMEGLCFDQHDNLYFVDMKQNIVYRVNVETKKLTAVFEKPGCRMVSVKVHRDGRLFVCCFNPPYGVFCINPDGTGYQGIEVTRNYVIDDLVFDSKGGFYFTHFIGEVNNPVGAVCYVDPEFKTVTPVVKNLASPNGVSLSTDESVLWITEHNGGRVLRFGLQENGLDFIEYSSYPAYQFSGKPGPDSCTIDDEDNLYVSMYKQGRYMIFQKEGYLVAQVFLPDRDKGLHMFTTHCKLRPGTKELYLIGFNETKEGGSWIFKAEGLGMANTHDFHLT